MRKKEREARAGVRRRERSEPRERERGERVRREDVRGKK